MLYLPFDSLTSLYVASALFGLFQGGLVPSYAIIVRTYFPPQEAARSAAMTAAIPAEHLWSLGGITAS